jgi:hypothetical protein
MPRIIVPGPGLDGQADSGIGVDGCDDKGIAHGENAVGVGRAGWAPAGRGQAQMVTHSAFSTETPTEPAQ